MTGPNEPRPSPRPLVWADIVFTLREILPAGPIDIVLVGGVVRDAFWGIPAHDVDLAVPRGGFEVARQIANQLGGAFYKLDPERETGRAIVNYQGERLVIDVANFRGDGLLADLTGRDFTLNAVAVPLHGDLAAVIDPLDGLADAQARILRQCSPESIPGDPVRILRAIRLSTRFDLRIEPHTLARMRGAVPRLAQASPERVRDEIVTLLGSRKPAAGLRALDSLGVLSLIVPEVETLRGVTQSAPHQYDVWQHTLEVIRQLEGVLQTISPRRTEHTAAQAGLGMIVYYLDRFRGQLQAHLAQTWPNERPHAALLGLAALLHDIGKPATRAVVGDRIRFLGHEKIGAALAVERATALRLSRAEIARIEQIILHHMRPHLLAQEPTLTRRAIYRFWRELGSAGIDVCLLALADYLATVGPTLQPEAWGNYLLRIGALLDGAPGPQAIPDADPLVTGNDLMRALGLKPGPRVGELLEMIQEAQAVGEIQTMEEALRLAREHLG